LFSEIPLLTANCGLSRHIVTAYSLKRGLNNRKKVSHMGQVVIFIFQLQYLKEEYEFEKHC
jgi:hypothetical protein